MAAEKKTTVFRITVVQRHSLDYAGGWARMDEVAPG
jgi:hypothetical protein